MRRYARHILLPDVGGAGQARFLAAEVEVSVGGGGTDHDAAGIAALAYLAAAGVGRLHLCGDPHGPVSAAEARAGILYGAGDVGTPRIAALRARIAAINPDVEVVAARPGHGAIPLAPAAPVPWPVPEQPGEAVAVALVIGGARAAQTLHRLACHESA